MDKLIVSLNHGPGPNTRNSRRMYRYEQESDELPCLTYYTMTCVSTDARHLPFPLNRTIINLSDEAHRPSKGNSVVCSIGQKEKKRKHHTVVYFFLILAVLILFFTNECVLKCFACQFLQVTKSLVTGQRTRLLGSLLQKHRSASRVRNGRAFVCFTRILVRILCDGVEQRQNRRHPHGLARNSGQA